MVSVLCKGTGYPETFFRCILSYGTAFLDISFFIIEKPADPSAGRSALYHIVVVIIFIFEVFAFRCSNTSQIFSCFPIFKSCFILLGIYNRRHFIILIIGIRLTKCFSVKGDSVKKCNISIIAVNIRDLHTDIILLYHIIIAQELPVLDIRAEVCIMSLCFSICCYKFYLYPKPAFFFIRCNRKRSSHSPCIDHVHIIFFSCKVQCFGEFFLSRWVSGKFIDMAVQSSANSRCSRFIQPTVKGFCF